MGRTAKRLTVIVVAATAMILVACEPLPERILFTVDSTGGGTDANPGDGICATASGTCTVAAALQEAAVASAGVDLVVPAGTYSVTYPVVGDVRINWRQPAPVQFVGSLSVVAGSRLAIDGINTALPTPFPPWGLTVHAVGEAQIHGSLLAQLEVSTGGVAVLDRSMVVNAEPGTVAVVNRGTMLAVYSSIYGYPDPGGLVLDNAEGLALLRASVIATVTVRLNGAPWATGGTGTCQGGTISDYGNVHVEVPCEPLGPSVAAGDAKVTADLTAILPSAAVSFDIQAAPDSPLVDAIAVDGIGCSTEAVDMLGQARGGDGNGDGIGGCDIGALERVDP